MVKYFLLMLVITLSGCSAFTTERIVYKTRTIEVPVEILSCPVIKLQPRPRLDIQNVNSESSDTEIFGAYPASIFQLKDYSAYLEKIIESQNGAHVIK